MGVKLKVIFRICFSKLFLINFQEKIEVLSEFSYERNEKRNDFVPFFVPQFSSFRSCLVPFEKFDFRSCLVPQKKERVHERVPFGTRSFIPCLSVVYF